jgi:hypothetical protein
MPVPDASMGVQECTMLLVLLAAVTAAAAATALLGLMGLLDGNAFKPMFVGVCCVKVGVRLAAHVSAVLYVEVMGVACKICVCMCRCRCMDAAASSDYSIML